MPSSEPPVPPETALHEAAEHDHELELLQPLGPAISSHTGGLPDMDMATGGGVGEHKKGVCGKCANCLACTRTKVAGE